MWEIWARRVRCRLQVTRRAAPVAECQRWARTANTKPAAAIEFEKPQEIEEFQVKDVSDEELQRSLAANSSPFVFPMPNQVPRWTNKTKTNSWLLTTYYLPTKKHNILHAI